MFILNVGGAFINYKAALGGVYLRKYGVLADTYVIECVHLAWIVLALPQNV